LATAYANRGAARSGKRQHDLAIADLNQAIRLAPAVAVLREPGHAYAGRGDARQAVADYSAAIQIDPTNASFYRSRAAAYRLLGDEASADDDDQAARERSH